MSNKGRGPSDTELLLWKAIRRTVKPIHRTPADDNNLKSETSLRNKPVFDETMIDPFPVKISEKPAAPKTIKNLDGRTYERLRRGKLPIEGMLDLHGMTQNQAHQALNNFVMRSYQSNKRCVLVITGKGLRSGGQGVLKSRLADWLALEPLNRIVLKHVNARQHHGGSGAFYLYLKRDRSL